MQKTSNITDNHGRPINYLRLAVTDRCNLRCFYCMPEEGIKYLPKKELLTYEEMIRLVEVLGEMGIDKVRIIGGAELGVHDNIEGNQVGIHNTHPTNIIGHLQHLRIIH